MARKPRNIRGGIVYHIINRATARAEIFTTDADYAAFERTLAQARRQFPIPILTFVLMPNHFHLVLWPRRGQEPLLSDFMRWLQLTHTQRWHAHHHTAGTGQLYQGRFKAFPIQAGAHVRRVCRYVERNPLRAQLCRHAEQWRWSGLWLRINGTDQEKRLLVDWPQGLTGTGPRWLEWVNTPEPEAELARLRLCTQRGRPFGTAAWVQSAAKRLHHTLRPRGRPKKTKK
jgi:putative transposase